ncbi:zinc finger, CCHC-type containing protein, partial [Tanacetum coccineum]
HTLKHLKEELTLVELGSHMRIEESLRMHDSDKPKGNNVIGPLVVNMVEHNSSSRYNDNKGKRKHHDNTKADPNKKYKVTCWKCGKLRHLKKDCKGGKVGNKANGSGTNGSVNGSTNSLKAYFVQDDDVAWWVDSGATVHVCKDLLLRKKAKDIRSPKEFGLNFNNLIQGTRDEVSDQHSYFFNVEDDPKIFDEAMKSHDVAFWKEAINDEIDSIMGNNTWVLADLPPYCKPLGCKWIFKRKLKVYGTVEKFKAMLVIQRFKQKLGRDYFDTYAPVAHISTIRLLIAMASIHSLIIHQMDVKTTFLNGELDEEVDLTNEFLSSRFSMKDMGEANVILGCISTLSIQRVIGCLMYVMTCTRPDIAFVVGKLSRYTSNPGTQHWQAIQRVLKYLKKTMDYRLTYTGYPLVLEGYTNASWIKSEFVALAAAGKKAEWLKILLLEILLWDKPIAPISIRCDSAATLAKAYSQMYIGKSGHTTFQKA